MFCDLVGSTALSARLDPEDLGAVIGEVEVAPPARSRPITHRRSPACPTTSTNCSPAAAGREPPQSESSGSPLALTEPPRALAGTDGLQTRRWRGMDSNFQFRDALASPTARLSWRSYIRRERWAEVVGGPAALHPQPLAVPIHQFTAEQSPKPGGRLPVNARRSR
jgi:hypothetical protein